MNILPHILFFFRSHIANMTWYTRLINWDNRCMNDHCILVMRFILTYVSCFSLVSSWSWNSIINLFPNDRRQYRISRYGEGYDNLMFMLKFEYLCNLCFTTICKWSPQKRVNIILTIVHLLLSFTKKSRFVEYKWLKFEKLIKSIH